MLRARKLRISLKCSARHFEVYLRPQWKGPAPAQLSLHLFSSFVCLLPESWTPFWMLVSADDGHPWPVPSTVPSGTHGHLILLPWPGPPSCWQFSRVPRVHPGPPVSFLHTVHTKEVSSASLTSLLPQVLVMSWWGPQRPLVLLYPDYVILPTVSLLPYSGSREWKRSSSCSEIWECSLTPLPNNLQGQSDSGVLLSF